MALPVTLTLGLLTLMVSPWCLPAGLDLSAHAFVGLTYFSCVGAAWLCGPMLLAAFWEPTE